MQLTTEINGKLALIWLEFPCPECGTLLEKNGNSSSQFLHPTMREPWVGRPKKINCSLAGKVYVNPMAGKLEEV